MSGGGGILNITKCTPQGESSEKDCIVGTLATKGDPIKYSESETNVYLVNRQGNVLTCTRNTKTDESTDIVFNQCRSSSRLLNIKIQSPEGLIDFYKDNASDQSKFSSITELYETSENDTSKLRKTTSPNGAYFIIDEADQIASFVLAYAVYNHNLKKPAFGYPVSDFGKNSDLNDYVVYARNSNGSVGRFLYDPKTKTTKTDETTKDSDKKDKSDTKEYEFQPVAKGAEDGGLIDINNEARAKATMIGTATGGALGGIAGYQGAKTELEQRWVEAVRTYNDSLSNFVCMTGGRFLAKYNDYVEIPDLKKQQQQ
jgi:hypothetical protein